MKKYIKPVMEIIQVECAPVMDASPGVLKYSSEAADNNVEALSKKQEHSWGSLWR